MEPEPDVVPIACEAGPSRRTTIQIVKDNSEPEKVPEVVTIADTSDPSVPRLAGVCYDYVPDESAGDVVTWSQTVATIVSAKCKGCGSLFPTMTVR